MKFFSIEAILPWLGFIALAQGKAVETPKGNGFEIHNVAAEFRAQVPTPFCKDSKDSSKVCVDTEFNCPGLGWRSSDDNCKFYYYCHVGKTYRYKCPEKTGFDPELLTCVKLQKDAECPEAFKLLQQFKTSHNITEGRQCKQIIFFLFFC